MHRIRCQDPESFKIAHRTLLWISCTLEPLGIKALQHALAVKPGDSDLTDEFLEEDDIVSTCAGLVTIDAQSGKIGLVHYTAQEYLEKERKKLFPRAGKLIAETCLTYLSFDIFARTSPVAYDPRSTVRPLRNIASHAIWDAHPLLEYALDRWGFHAHEAFDEIRNLSNQFLSQEKKLAWAFGSLMFYSKKRQHDWNSVVCSVEYTYIPSLILIASSGFDQFARRWLQLHPDIDLEVKGPAGVTPVHCAAATGHPEMLKLLIDKGADVNAQNKEERTALVWAVREHRDDIVQILLERGVDVNMGAGENNTLSCVSSGGNPALMELLLEHGADVNFRYGDGETPLMAASLHTNAENIKCLLKRGADINAKDDFGRTALMHASLHGSVENVKALLDWGSAIPT